ncbi:HAD family phosphatase [Sneathiella marina]|uniref:HAD family phosphatase n=1 Tax=Sneathiella marina TaxID=2950108 RepID=A0ABY4W5H1_9PROT|nr:HAD family phosphatase [Sneathiella marina]USG61358.1 HAD family phosphatase [Sneathiella marina]
MSVKLVIFDCDGVLVDSEPIANNILSKSLTRYGLPVAPEECLKLFLGGTMKTVAKTAMEKGATLPPEWIAEIYGEIYSALEEGVPIIDGIMDVLDHLDNAGIPYCVASNGSIEKMKITLGHTGLLSRFYGRLFSAHEIGIAKPDPGLFLFAAKQMGAAPSNTVVIEDSENGVMAAQRAHMRCYGYSPHDEGAHLADKDAVVFKKMSMLSHILEI